MNFNWKALTGALNFIVSIVGNAAVIGMVPDPYKWWVVAVGNGLTQLLAYLANPTGEKLGAFLGKK